MHFLSTTASRALFFSSSSLLLPEILKSRKYCVYVSAHDETYRVHESGNNAHTTCNDLLQRNTRYFFPKDRAFFAKILLSDGKTFFQDIDSETRYSASKLRQNVVQLLTDVVVVRIYSAYSANFFLAKVCHKKGNVCLSISKRAAAAVACHRAMLHRSWQQFHAFELNALQLQDLCCMNGELHSPMHLSFSPFFVERTVQFLKII